METRLFRELIAAAATREQGSAVDMETVPYIDAKGEVQQCLGIALTEPGSMIPVAAMAMHMVYEGFDGQILDEDMNEMAEDLIGLLQGSLSRPFMDWTMFYWPGLTQAQIDEEEKNLYVYDPCVFEDVSVGSLFCFEMGSTSFMKVTTNTYRAYEFGIDCAVGDELCINAPTIQVFLVYKKD